MVECLTPGGAAGSSLDGVTAFHSLKVLFSTKSIKEVCKLSRPGTVWSLTVIRAGTVLGWSLQGRHMHFAHVTLHNNVLSFRVGRAVAQW